LFVLYGYENCNHNFENGRYLKCLWNGSVSDFIKNEMKRIVDKPFNYNSYYELEVKCPHCGGMGIVNREDEYFHFQCTNCL